LGSVRSSAFAGDFGSKALPEPVNDFETLDLSI
jgi:hypothetical protein